MKNLLYEKPVQALFKSLRQSRPLCWRVVFEEVGDRRRSALRRSLAGAPGVDLRDKLPAPPESRCWQFFLACR